MRLRLTPREDSYFDLFTAQAQHLVTGANLLAEMLGADRPARKEIGKRFAEAERTADEATHTIMQRLNQTFVTPFDRDDIYLLASRLDDCMDFMEEAADLVVLYKVETLPPRVADMVQVPTPIAMVMAVNTAAVPRCCIASSKASRKVRALSFISCWMRSNR